ncbi:MAG: DMT family transporter [Acidobacteriota bacterium]
MKTLPGWAAIVIALGLFAIWSNTFIAIGYLLGAELSAARFDAVGLTVARALPSGLVCSLYCFGFRPRESIALLRRHGFRLALCGLLVVPIYNLCLFLGQEHGVAAPIASITTALAPLFILVLSVIFLGESKTPQKLAGLALSLLGMATIAAAHPTGGNYGLMVAVTALAPLSWSIYSVICKPLTREVSPLLLTYLPISLGTLPLLAIAPFKGLPEMVALDSTGWAAVLYLSLLATVLGFALWTYLLRSLPASTVGLTVFLNPPMTLLSKAALASLLPAVFTFRILPLEWLGGGLALAGLAVATVLPRRPSTPPP